MALLPAGEYVQCMPPGAIEACEWGYPLVLFDAIARRNARIDDAALDGIVLPNDDVAVQTAWLDLRRGPMALVLDETTRYHSLQLFDATGRTFGSLGTRTTGNEHQAYAIAPPSWRGTVPHGMQTIEAPTRRIALIGRTVQVAGDLDNLQFSVFAIGPRANIDGATNNTIVHSSSESIAEEIQRLGGRDFFERLERLLLDDLGANANAFAWRAVIENALHSDSRTLDEAFDVALAKIEADFSMTDSLDGWKAHPSGFHFLAGDEQDVLYRFARTDDVGHDLHGRFAYRLHFDAWNEPPARAFWSIMVCDEKLRRFPNRGLRSNIGSRNKLVKNADDSIDITIQADAPAESNVNWLPVPQRAFRLILRLYWPRRLALDGVWSPPAIRAASVLA